MHWPVSVKGVVLDEHGRVLLGKNDRQEWELLGGRLEAGETPEQTLVREMQEEAGLAVVPEQLLRAWVFEPVPGSQVLIVTFGCKPEGGIPRSSSEHSNVAFHDRKALGRLQLPRGYRFDIDLWRAAGAAS